MIKFCMYHSRVTAMSPYLLILVLHMTLALLSVRSRAEQKTLQCEKCEEALGGCWDEHKNDGECHGAAIQENQILASGWNCAISTVPASCECSVEQKIDLVDHAISITSGVSSVSSVDSTFFKLTVGWSASNENKTNGKYLVTLKTQPGYRYICCSTHPSTSFEVLLPYQQFDQVDVVVSPSFCQRTSNMARSFYFPTISLPSSCHNIAGSGPLLCSLPRYGPPQDVTISTYPVPVLNDAGKILKMDAHISWLPPPLPSPQSPLPALYYIDVNFETFFKTNATSIMITGMDASKQYQISVEAYMPCAESVCSVATFYKSFRLRTLDDDAHHHRRSDAMETAFAEISAISKVGRMGVVTAFFLLIVILLAIPIMIMRLVRSKGAESVRKRLDKLFSLTKNTDAHLNSSTVSLWLSEEAVNSQN